MQRVLVIGISGAGKSTLSRVLAERTGLPLIHLDKEYWRPGWTITPRAEWRPKVEELAARERWVMDGNFDSSLDLRLPRADTLIWFDYPTLLCLWRAMKRVARSYGMVRSDMGADCPERIDLDFLRYIWRFNRIQRPRILRQIADHGRHLTPIVLRRDREVRALLADLALPAR
jgi:adenylate kinase family enzyme